MDHDLFRLFVLLFEVMRCVHILHKYSQTQCSTIDCGQHTYKCDRALRSDLSDEGRRKCAHLHYIPYTQHRVATKKKRSQRKHTKQITDDYVKM